MRTKGRMTCLESLLTHARTNRHASTLPAKLLLDSVNEATDDSAGWWLPPQHQPQACFLTMKPPPSPLADPNSSFIDPDYQELKALRTQLGQ